MFRQKGRLLYKCFLIWKVIWTIKEIYLELRKDMDSGKYEENWKSIRKI